jgi:hypothetical protein
MKKSLSSQFINAKAYKLSPTSYSIEMNAFFAERIKSSPQDMAILRGVIAEIEGVDPSSVAVTVEARAEEKKNDIIF